MDDRQRALVNSLFKLTAAEFSRCFAPPTLCEMPAIRAHSVQNAQALDLLAVRGHVVGLSRRLFADKPPAISFAPIGRNKATTFAGLCAAHDQVIFSPIDTAQFVPTNPDTSSS